MDNPIETHFWRYSSGKQGFLSKKWRIFCQISRGSTGIEEEEQHNGKMAEDSSVDLLFPPTQDAGEEYESLVTDSQKKRVGSCLAPFEFSILPTVVLRLE